jgi:hypothetical protein
MKFSFAMGAGICLFVVALALAVTAISATNRDVELRAAAAAQQEALATNFDKLWKTIQQQAEVATAERESFRKTYVEIMNAQRGQAGNGSLASFLSQAGVTVSPELFRQLMTSIEAQRESFNREQTHLIKIKQEHDTLRGRFPSSIFVGGRPPIEIQLVTSARTEEALSSGREDGVHVFGAPPPAESPKQ